MTLFLFWCTNNESFRFWKDQFQTKTCKISNSKLEPNILQLELIRDCFHENSSLPVGDAELFIRGAAPVMLQWFPILLTKFLPFKGGTQNPSPPFWTPMFTIYSWTVLYFQCFHVIYRCILTYIYCHAIISICHLRFSLYISHKLNYIFTKYFGAIWTNCGLIMYKQCVTNRCRLVTSLFG